MMWLAAVAIVLGAIVAFGCLLWVVEWVVDRCPEIAATVVGLMILTSVVLAVHELLTH